MHLSPHFTLDELTETEQPFDNTPPKAAIAELTRLCLGFLEPLRVHTGPIKVTSGFRSPKVNVAVGGSATSAHLAGRAADVFGLACDLEYFWGSVLVCERGPASPGWAEHIDQAIYYVRPKGAGWVHLGIAAAGRSPRREFLVQPAGLRGYVQFATYRGPMFA